MLTDLKEQQLDIDCRSDILDEFKDTVWRPMQQEIIDLCQTVPDGRTLHWYHEPTGYAGKTRVTRYLAAMNLAYCPDVTKPADIFCGYNREPVVIFDIPRSKIEHMDHLYGVVEKFIDGLIFVGKYKSRSMPIKPPHVIVFSNDPPKLSILNEKTGVSHDTLSRDRWHIVDIAREYGSASTKRKKCDDDCTNPNCRCKPDSFAKKRTTSPNADSDVAPPFALEYK